MSDRTPEPERLLTPAEVATMFRVDPKTVTRWAKAGKLTSIRTLGGHRRYRQSEVYALFGGVPQPQPVDPLSAPVGTLWPVDARPPGVTVRNRLLAAGVGTIRNLTAHTAAMLADDIGLSSPQVDEVRLVLYRKNLALRGEVLDKVA
jgi:excisionase family DNA binding protein